VITDPSEVNNGAVDFGGAAPVGQDYPSSGFYNMTPEDIVNAAHADAQGASNTIQINHIHSFFGIDGGSGSGDRHRADTAGVGGAGVGPPPQPGEPQLLLGE
jgi:hypothetical protein